MDDPFPTGKPGEAAGESPGFFGTEKARPSEQIEPETFAEIDDYLARNPGGTERLVPLLYRVQAAQGYLPFAVQEYIADKLGLSPIQVHGVVSFYNYFGSTPPNPGESR
jgi:NADH:ubiquinone oxidoreductase subunit E